MKDLKTKWLPLAAVVASLWAGGMTSAQAAACVADPSNLTNPDATVTDSVNCGYGTTAENDNFTEVKLAENVTGYNLDWTQLAKADVPSRSKEDPPVDATFTDGALSYTTANGLTSGTWSITTNLALNVNDFLLVLKDGAGIANAPTWFWFILDETNPSNFSCGDATLCGTWSMFGENGKAREISHMTLYVAENEGGSGNQGIPEPGPLSLIGLGLMGLWFARRKTSA